MRPADAIARGGSLDALVERLQAARAEALEGQLRRQTAQRAHVSLETLEHRLRAKLTEWRALLRRNVTEGRAVLRTLLIGVAVHTCERPATRLRALSRSTDY
jgi:hypothetical protein